MFTYQKKFLIISDSNKDRFIEKETDQTLNDDGYTCWLENLSKISLIVTNVQYIVIIKKISTKYIFLIFFDIYIAFITT